MARHTGEQYDDLIDAIIPDVVIKGGRKMTPHILERLPLLLLKRHLHPSSSSSQSAPFFTRFLARGAKTPQDVLPTVCPLCRLIHYSAQFKIACHINKVYLEECPNAIKELADMENLTGRKVAIDASMALYQFLVAVRTSGNGQAATQLTNEAGDVTSHIQGMFNRTIKMMASGIKPVYVFDGKAPQMKGGELAKRTAKRAKAMADLETAKASENMDDMDKFNRRLVKVTRQHNEECRELLRLMGVPFIIAPCEAEAQCAELAKKGKVYATATEDMDALTFRTPKLLRKLTFSQGKDKQPIVEIDMETVLKGLELSYEQFVDLCILCGCDYCNTIKGVGPKTALKLIRTYKTLEQVVAALHREKKHEIPPDWFPMRIRKSEPKNAEAEAEEVEESIEVVAGGVDEIDSAKKGGCENLSGGGVEPEAAERADEVSESACVADIVGEANSSDEVAAPLPLPESTEREEENKVSLPVLVEGEEGMPLPVLVEGGAEEEGVEYEDVPALYQQARLLFLEAEVSSADEVDLKWIPPDEDGLREFLVTRMGFSGERVTAGVKRLQEAHQKKSQQRMDSFFSTLPKAATPSSTSSGVKRKPDDKGKKGGGPAGKKGPGASKMGRR